MFIISLQRVATVNVFVTVGFSHAITPIIVISGVATIIQPSFDIQGKTHGQESAVRGYHPATTCRGGKRPSVGHRKNHFHLGVPNPKNGMM